MSVKIGHASIDERNKIKGGSAGDQSKKEVCTRSWYNAGWNKVIRANDPAVAEKIASAMEEACTNNNIGYDQSQRTTLYQKAKAKNWQIDKITEKCECDCSSLVAVCVNASGIAVSKDIYTGNEAKALNATGKFTIYTGSKYTDIDLHLKRGDILLKEGYHTAVVLTDGEKVTTNSNSATTSGYTGSSIVDYLKSINKPSDFNSRVKYAKQYGIANYIGTESQNLRLLDLMRKGKVTGECYPAFRSSSIVSGLNAIGIDSSFEFRKRIARANGIANYTGSYKQNVELLDLAKKGKLLKP